MGTILFKHLNRHKMSTTDDELTEISQNYIPLQESSTILDITPLDIPNLDIPNLDLPILDIPTLERARIPASRTATASRTSTLRTTCERTTNTLKRIKHLESLVSLNYLLKAVVDLRN